MNIDPKKLSQVVNLLNEKACVKQRVYRNMLQFFGKMKDTANILVEDLTDKITGLDRTVEVKYDEIGQFEFHVKLSGDLVVFSMHSNAVTFPENHILTNNDYILEDPRRKYFGALMVYNFLADSIKYRRVYDEGYLIARMYVNFENHFYIEGVRQLNFLYPDIKTNVLTDSIFSEFLESTFIASMDNDSIMPAYEAEKTITVGQKLNQSMIGRVEKVGFVMSSDEHKDIID